VRSWPTSVRRITLEADPERMLGTDDIRGVGFVDVRGEEHQ
jgi:hypothetical protein